MELSRRGWEGAHEEILSTVIAVRFVYVCRGVSQGGTLCLETEMLKQKSLTTSSCFACVKRVRGGRGE